MALALTCEIRIGDYLFDYAHQIEVVSTWKSLSDTASIQLPNVRGLSESTIQVGDRVEILTGYNYRNRLIFSGYANERIPGQPFTINCIDESFRLTRTLANGGKAKMWHKVKLRSILQELLKDFRAQLDRSIPDITVDTFRIEDSTSLYKVMEVVKEHYLVAAYFRGETLYVGLPYYEFLPTDTFDDREAGRFNDFIIGWNIAEHSLTFRRAEDKRIKIEASAKLASSGKNTKVEVGDADGEAIKLKYRSVASQEALKALAESALKEAKREGYTGSFTAFGEPPMVHSGSVRIGNDLDNRDGHTGTYIADEVKTTWGVNGYRQEIKPALRLT